MNWRKFFYFCSINNNILWSGKLPFLKSKLLTKVDSKFGCPLTWFFIEKFFFLSKGYDFYHGSPVEGQHSLKDWCKDNHCLFICPTNPNTEEILQVIFAIANVKKTRVETYFAVDEWCHWEIGDGFAWRPCWCKV